MSPGFPRNLRHERRVIPRRVRDELLHALIIPLLQFGVHALPVLAPLRPGQAAQIPARLRIAFMQGEMP
jgi:hypothetical protein